MCGISGHIAGGVLRDDLSVRRMNDALAHRGPNAAGIWRKGNGALGHRRLSIIDLSEEANQPLLNEDGTIGAVVNGEIYNFVELRERLAARGHVFRSLTDSEVVVHLYEEHGTDCIAMLTGMFALAIWDSRAQRLVLARDRAGKKPLFYRELPGGGLAFASEVQALRAGFPELPATVDLESVDEFLTLTYVPSPRSIYREMHKLGAAQLLVHERGRPPVKERYWRKPQGPELRGKEEDLAQELRHLLERAVRRRLVSDVPLGAFLSGGVDSSALVALMATQTSRRVKTFSIGFPAAGDSELSWARMVAKQYDTDHHEAIVTPDIADTVRSVVRRHGEPFADSSAVAMACLAKMTKEHVTVALSGDASDETFAGYTRYVTARLGHIHDALPAPLQRGYARASWAMARRFSPHVAGYFEHMGAGEAVRYPYIMCQFTPDEKRLLYVPEMRAAMTTATTDRFRRVLDETAGRSSALRRLVDLDWHTYLVDDINEKVDIASMAVALEVRCPYLDTDVVEFASRLPARLLQRVRGKHLLRRAVQDLVPGPIMRRSKRGFGLPLRRWMKDDLRELVHDVLFSRAACERGLFERANIASLVGAMGSGRDFAAPERVWTLLVLELWFQEVVDKPAVSSSSPRDTRVILQA